MERVIIVSMVAGLIAWNLVIWSKILYHLFKIPLTKMLKSEADDEYIAAARRNIKRLVRSDETRACVDCTKIFYSNLSNGIGGQFLYSTLGTMILIDQESTNRQNVIEHELLHAVDRHLGITKSRSLKGVRLRDKSERVDWLVSRFGSSLEEAENFVEVTEKDRQYWTSDDELFATMNGLRLYMLKRVILKRQRDLITPDSITRILDEVRRDGTTKYDFFTMLSFVGTDSETDFIRINGVFDMIDSLI